MATWIVLGASPQAPEAYLRAKETPHDAVITTNGGILLEPAPTYYALLDPHACRMYADHALRAREAGATLVTKHFNPPEAANDAGVGHFDLFVKPRFPLTLSGLFCVEFACLNGADTVLMCGLDGYFTPDGQDNCYFAGVPGRKHDRGHTRNVLPYRTADIFREWPGVQFVSMGAPLWRPHGEHANWSIA
ncbi:MAG: hypothetical protein DWQ20_00760 [Actinobacteria bacterium]|mgnify:CR=1 FL=1|nr:MAG: hypothetical protein DWQ20_00760 [Actinomycetota bacterium]